MSEPPLHPDYNYEGTGHSKSDRSDAFINPFKATVTYIQANKGGGKSCETEHVAEVNYNYGHTVVDILSADNYENCFYSINLNCKKYWDDWRKNNPDKPEQLHCNCFKRYKTLIIVPDYTEINQDALDDPRVNHKCLTKEEYKQYVKEKKIKDIIEWNNQNPPKIPNPDYTEWVKVMKLTIPNKGFKNRERFVEQLTKILLCGRDERRFIVLNPAFMSDKNHKFRLVEQIIREIGVIVRTHFKPHTPQTVAEERKTAGLKETRDAVPFSGWTDQEKNHHRVTLILREFGSVAPAGLKGEALETLVKKALLNIIRVVRQYRMSLIADFQRHGDIIASIRDQRDYFFFKQINQDMFPMDSYKWVWDAVIERRKQLEMMYGHAVAEHQSPRIDDLHFDEMYVIYPTKTKTGKRFRKVKSYMPNFHHRQEDDDYEQLTGITKDVTWKFVARNSDGEMVDSEKDRIAEDKKVMETNQQKIYEVASRLKKPTDTTKKKMTNEEIYNHLNQLGMLPDGWKSSDALRKFMKRYEDNLIKVTQ